MTNDKKDGQMPIFFLLFVLAAFKLYVRVCVQFGLVVAGPGALGLKHNL